eukprot:6209402-Pleurochrysis_carterae.AAC.1
MFCEYTSAALKCICPLFGARTRLSLSKVTQQVTAGAKRQPAHFSTQGARTDLARTAIQDWLAQHAALATTVSG